MGPVVSGETMPCDIDEMRTLFLFEKLDDAQIVGANAKRCSTHC